MPKKLNNDLKISLRICAEDFAVLFARYKTDSPSEALHGVLRDALLLCDLHQAKFRRHTPAETLEMVTADKRPKNKKICVRESEAILLTLKKFYGIEKARYRSDALRCAIYDVLSENHREQSLQPHENIFYYMGQKNPKMQDFLNAVFADIEEKYAPSSYIEPFAGSGNVLLHKPRRGAETLNELDADTVNLLRVLRDFPFELKRELLKLDVNQETFNKAKAELKEAFSLKSTKYRRIQRAAMTFYVKYASIYGKGESFNNKTTEIFHKKLDILHLLSKRLQNVNIRKSDALYFCKTQNFNNALLYFDPPYVGSENYYTAVKNTAQAGKKNSLFRLHSTLRRRIEELRKNNICIISYRTTASPTMEANGFDADYVRKVLDRLYCGQGFHMALLPLKNGKIEILIGTVAFKDSTPYVRPLSEQEVTRHA